MYQYKQHSHNLFPPATPKQIELLEQLGFDGSRLSGREADLLIKQNLHRWSALPPTDKQRFFLISNFAWREGITRGEATELIDKIKRASQHLW